MARRAPAMQAFFAKISKVQTKITGITRSAEKVNAEISRILSECNEIAGGPPSYSLPSSGKLVRTRFTLLLGNAIGLDINSCEKLSVSAELTHTASLLHDDCVDGSSLRRGRPTANERLGINRAILLGDLVVSHAFRSSGSVSQAALAELILAVQKMSTGALLEERFRYKKRTQSRFEEILSLKTGSLFGWCAVSCCHMAGKYQLLESCQRIGVETGVSFQIIDDVLDFQSPGTVSGKDALKDLTEGRLTLPVLMALDDPLAGPEVQSRLESLQSSDYPDIKTALEIAEVVRSGGFLEKARHRASVKISEIVPLIRNLTDEKTALELKSYLWALTQRTL